MWLSDVFPQYEGKPWHECDRNMINIPITWIDTTETGVEEFNKIYRWILDQEPYEYVKTKSGGICVKPYMFRTPCYNVNVIKSGVEIVYIDYYAYRFRFRTSYKQGEDDNWSVSGSRGFETFKRLIKKFGGNIENIAIDNGKEVKTTMPKPLIYCKDEFIGQTLENVYHADINSAYMAGIKDYASMMRYKDSKNYETWDALCKTIDELFNNRKSSEFGKKHYKSVLNVSYGFMQSQWCRLKGKGYALAHLSKIALESCIAKLQEFTAYQEHTGGIIVAYNTDGVFFIPSQFTEYQYKSQLASPDKRLGEFKIDKFCKKLRFKSNGAYEYVDEDDRYTPVVRGRTILDSIKPREEWEWGDIYQHAADVIRYKFIEGIGIKK